MKRFLFLVAFFASATALPAQSRFDVRVADTTGEAISYAVLDASQGGRRVADSLGFATFDLPTRIDSLIVQVRRIGYQPTSLVLYSGAPRREITLATVPRALSAMVISDRRNSILVHRGFYDRLERVRSGAQTGEFITPEDLERMSPSSVSRALVESRYVRIARHGGRQQAVLLGRAGCGYTILIDGNRVHGTLEEEVIGSTSISSRGTARGRADTSIDEMVMGLEIAAIEVYPSAANAPSEIQTRAAGGRGACGIIAIWTGRGQ